jgi:hypothetical protein
MEKEKASHRSAAHFMRWPLRNSRSRSEGTVTLVSGSDSSAVKAKITEKIVAYLKNLALTAEDIPGTKERSILINTIGSLIMTTDGVNDYTGLTLNGGTTNATYTHKTAPVLSQNNLTFA